MHDTLLVYAKTAATTFRPLVLPYEEKYLAAKYANSDDRGRYRLGDLTAPGVRKGDSGATWQGVDVSSRRRHWVAPSVIEEVLGPESRGMGTREKLDALLAAGYVQLPDKPDGVPQFKRYLDEEGGVALGDLWTDITVLNSQSKERLGFDTQKPEQLVERIVKIATDPGDIVLDCFVGSGTTAAVAHKLGRRWVACEREQDTVEHYVMPRLKAVVDGRDASGITKSVGWAGGGGFRVLDVHPSMFERTDDDRVVVAPWATGGALAEAVAAQAAFRFDPEDIPFCGRKGKTRLAVVDGLLNPEVLDLLVSWLDSDELLTVYGTAVDPDCHATLAQLRLGSNVKKIPQSILDDYRRSFRSKRGDVIDWPSVVLTNGVTGKETVK